MSWQPFLGFPRQRGTSGTARPWNASDKGANIVLSNSNYDATSNSGGAWQSVRNIYGASGKIYWECTITALSTANRVLLGVADINASMSDYIGNTTMSASLQSGIAIYVNGCTLDYATAMPTFAANDWFAFALDMSAGRLYAGRNGTWFNSGNPTGGTGFVVSALSGTIYPACSIFSSGNAARLNDGSSAFNGSAPSGFTPLNGA